MSTEPITHAQLAQQAAFIAERASNWASCLMGPLPNWAEPVRPEMVARFVTQIRQRLETIEEWSGPTSFAADPPMSVPAEGGDA